MRPRSRAPSIVSSAVAAGALVLPLAAQELPPAKATAVAAVGRHADALRDAATRIWEWAEPALSEHRSSELLAGMLERAGFDVQRGLSDMPTAFVATFGSGEPVVAYLAEFDALPGLSQEAEAVQRPREEGGWGHGCGHNLFGAGSVGAALALAEAMAAHDLPGTVRLYGTPAEEHGIGKVFLVRDGHFDDVAACLSWHPGDENEVDLQPSKALRSFEVTFHGRSAHAAGAPWKGVSALDALEAFTTGVNLLREHVPETARVHYVVTGGGDAPNVVPDQASAWLFTRGEDWAEQEQVYEHVLKIVDGADLMAWGEEHGHAQAGWREPRVEMFTGLYHYNPNLAVAQLVHENLVLVGPPRFSESEQAFGRALQEAFGVEPVGFLDTLEPFDPHAEPEPGGSTDVANISWVCPTIDLGVANWPKDVPAHSWASTAASGSSAGLSAMLVAAQVLAASGVDVLTAPERVAAARAELQEKQARFPYVSPVGPDDLPAVPSHLRGQ